MCIKVEHFVQPILGCIGDLMIQIEKIKHKYDLDPSWQKKTRGKAGQCKGRKVRRSRETGMYLYWLTDMYLYWLTGMYLYWLTGMYLYWLTDIYV